MLSCDPALLLASSGAKDYDDLTQAIPEAVSRTSDWALLESSSLVWVCSSNERRSFVTILDANCPNAILSSFPVCSSHLLCIGSVAGIMFYTFVLMIFRVF
jgi:hypothetical protein